MKKALSLLLAVLLLTICFVPMAFAEDGAPSREDIRGHGDITPPKKDSWLSSYETRYVCSSGGVAAFLFKAPKLDNDLVFDNVLEGTELTLLAKETDTKNNVDFYLVKLADRRVGWICVGQTSEDTKLLDSVPELKEGTWILKLGESDKDTYAVKFGAQRTATLLRLSDGRRFTSHWILSCRRVRVKEMYLTWNGEEFVGRTQYKTADGKVYCTLTADTEGLYDKLAG